MERGMRLLVNDLEQLLLEVHKGLYADFDDDALPAPKMALAEKFEKLKRNVINGEYDEAKGETPLCGRPENHNNGDFSPENCAECSAIKLNI